jgi:hypothetical protein
MFDDLPKTSNKPLRFDDLPTGKPAEAAPAEDEMSAVDVGDVAKSFAVGVPKGAMDVVGGPGDLQALGRSYNPFDYLAERFQQAYPKTAAANVKRAERVGRISDIGEVRLPTTQEVRGQVEKATGPLYEPKTALGRYSGSIGEAAASSVLQPGGLLTKAVTTVGGGVGAQAGGDLAEAAGLPRPVGGVVGGVVGGGGAGLAAQGRTAARARKLLPTSEANRLEAKKSFGEIEQAGLVIDPTAASNFATGLRADLEKGLFSRDVAGRAYLAADQIERAGGDLKTIMGVHSALGEVTPGEGSQYAAAMLARDAIREKVANLQPNEVIRGDPVFITDKWQHARDTWRIHSNLEEIYGALESAEWRRLSTGSGTNLNTIRQNIRRILDNDNKVRRYSPEAKKAMEDVVEGSLARNTMRTLAKFAPHGPVSSIPVALSMATGHADFGTAIAAGGFIAHFFQGKMEQRSLDALLDIIREGSPLITPKAQKMLSRAREPIAGVSTVRGSILGAGADSPLADQPPPEEAPLAHPGL